MSTEFYFKDTKVMKDLEDLKQEIHLLKLKYPEVKFDTEYLNEDGRCIAKTMAGWKPTFRASKNIKSVKDIKDQYDLMKKWWIIQDEYGTTYNWKEFEERVVNFNPDGKSHVEDTKCKYPNTWEESCFLDEEGYEFITY